MATFASVDDFSLDVSHLDVWTGKNPVAVKWNAPNALLVWVEARPGPVDYKVPRDPDKALLVSTGRTQLRLADDTTRVVLIAELPNQVVRHIEVPVRRGPPAHFYAAFVAAMVAIVAELAGFCAFAILPDQTERSTVGLGVRVVSWVLGATGVLAAIPAIATVLGIAGRVVRFDFGWILEERSRTVLFCVLCLALTAFPLAGFIATDGILVLNETDEMVYFIANGDVDYAFPKGLSIIRPIATRFPDFIPRPGTPFTVAYHPRPVVAERSGTTALRLRCVDRLKVIVPDGATARLVVDGTVVEAPPEEAKDGIVFELPAPHCPSVPLAYVTDVALEIAGKKLHLRLRIKGSGMPQIEATTELLSWTVVAETLTVPWSAETTITASTKTVTTTGTCRSGTCSLLFLKGRANEAMAWKVPDDEARKIGSVPWTLDFKAAPRELKDCLCEATAIGAYGPFYPVAAPKTRICPLRAIPLAADDALHTYNGQASITWGESPNDDTTGAFALWLSSETKHAFVLARADDYSLMRVRLRDRPRSEEHDVPWNDPLILTEVTVDQLVRPIDATGKRDKRVDKLTIDYAGTRREGVPTPKGFRFAIGTETVGDESSAGADLVAECWSAGVLVGCIQFRVDTSVPAEGGCGACAAPLDASGVR